MSSLPSSSAPQPLLGPVLGLCSWTLIVEIWLYTLRIPALQKYKISTHPDKIQTEMARIPPAVHYPAQNYNHLMEQPTQFYATALALNALGVDDGLTVGLAWGYVGLRVVHSLVQGTSNRILVRFQIFATSGLVLAGLTALAWRRWM